MQLGPGHGIEAVDVAAVDGQHERSGLPGVQPALDHVAPAPRPWSAEMRMRSWAS